MAEEKKYNFTEFKAITGRMVSTNDQAYSRNPSRGAAFTYAYTEDTAKDAIAQGDLDQLIELSRYYWYASGLYRGFICYFTVMSTYDTFVTPQLKVALDLASREKLEKDYYSAVNFIDSLDVKLEFSRITMLTLINGTYYGLFREYEGEKFLFQDLPIGYCRTRFKDTNKLNILEFDLEYFNTIRDEKLREEAFKDFPPSFKSQYNAAKKDRDKRWIMVTPEEGGVVFFYQEQKPFFISTIPTIIKLDEYREVEEVGDRQRIRKLLIQAIPLDKDTNEPVFELPEVEMMHDGTVGMLRNIEGIDVLTTLANIKIESLQDAREVLRDNLEKIERSIYIDAGVSKEVFNSTGGIALESSIKKDEAIVFDILKRYDAFLKFQLNSRFESKLAKWNCKILPITVKNREKTLEGYLKNAQFGYSKILPAIASGVSQAEFMGSLFVENDLLGLTKLMIPLQSSHTGAIDDEGGAPAKPIEDKNDKTAENIDDL